MIKHDRYGNSLTTSSAAAYDAYCEGVDLFLAAQAGGIELMQQACELDPGFAVAHADVARALQICAQPKAAKQAIARAEALLPTLAGSAQAQERSHVLVMQDLLTGHGESAFAKIREHIKTWPRDVLVVLPCCGVFGLIGFSGRTGREQENTDFMATLKDDYAGDWWFESQYAFALCETGDLAAAETLNEAAFAANPANANAVHHRAHIHYETGEFTAGHEALRAWRASYDPASILHCHLAWHDALWSLAKADYDALWTTVRSCVLPEVATAPPINVMTDLVSVLLRAELAGAPVDQALWTNVSDYALQSFPRAGLSFADAHAAIAYATTGADAALAPLLDSPQGPAGDVVAQVAQAFVAFRQSDWPAFTDLLAPALAMHERLGGSRAQRDLLELSYQFGLHQQGKMSGSPRLSRVLPAGAG